MIELGTVVVLHPEPDTYEQLSRPAQVEDGVVLLDGEIGTIDCSVRFVGTPGLVAAIGKAVP